MIIVFKMNWIITQQLKRLQGWQFYVLTVNTVWCERKSAVNFVNVDAFVFWQFFWIPITWMIVLLFKLHLTTCRWHDLYVWDVIRDISDIISFDTSFWTKYFLLFLKKNITMQTCASILLKSGNNMNEFLTSDWLKCWRRSETWWWVCRRYGDRKWKSVWNDSVVEHERDRLRPIATSANFDFGRFWDVEFWDDKGWIPEGWIPEGWSPEGWRPRRVEPEGGGPKISRFFFFPSSRHNFLSSLCLGSFTWNLGGVWSARALCTFGLSGCRVKPCWRPH